MPFTHMSAIFHCARHITQHNQFYWRGSSRVAAAHSGE